MRRSCHALMLAAAISASGLLTTGLGCGATADVSRPPDAAVQGGQTAVPIKQVVLFSSGVGYFQHEGTVDGDAVTQLQFSAKQINDVLKSLVLQDTGGSVSAVTYASQDPLEKTLKSFQVDITANPSLDQLLNQLRGAKVTVDLATEKPEGTILGVEKRVKPAGSNKTYEIPVLNLVTDDGVRSIEMTDVRDIRLDDPVLQDELNKALAALAGARDQDKKPVTIHFAGQGKRAVLMGYVVETPVWKTSYRLVLGDASGSDAKLQGWAIVENQTDNDWIGVQLSLVSGRPISFIEDLYQPLYNPRAIVNPRQYAGIIRPEYPAGMDRNLADSAKMEAAAPSALGGAVDGISTVTPIDITRSIQSIASATKVGELFQYTIPSVTLPRQSSAMLPIVTDTIHVDRLSIYNASVMPHNPLNGARLKNTTDKHLLGGPLTVFEANSYAGDAQIDDLPPGQDRLVSYGIDLQMLVDSHPQGRADETMTAKIVAGVLQVTHQYIQTTVYDARNKSDHDKQLLIEHSIQGADWTLVDTPAPVEKADQLDRFEETVPAGKSAELVVKEKQVADQTFALLGQDVDSIIAFSNDGSIPKSVREALDKVADMKGQIADNQRKLDADHAKEQEIVDDQKRINETLRTISQNTQLYTRLMEKLNNQETDLEKLRSQADDLSQKATDLQKQLQDYLGSINVG